MSVNYKDRVALMAAELSARKGELIGIPSTTAWKRTVEMIASRHGMPLASFIRYAVNQYVKESDPDFPLVYEQNIRECLEREG